MDKSSRTILLALMVAATPCLVAPVVAATITSPLMLRSAVVPSVETVRYRHGYGGAAVGLGIAGALIGGAIIGATQPPYGYYGYPSGYYGPAYVAPAPTLVATQSAVVCNAQGPTTRIPGPMSVTMACDIHARGDV